MSGQKAVLTTVAEIAPYRAKKDTVQFFYAEPVPYDLIGRVAAALRARHADWGRAGFQERRASRNA